LSSDWGSTRDIGLTISFSDLDGNTVAKTTRIQAKG
jgi:hypothetical protein